jgi:serine/threonine protein kinase/formylglycine-generating enzyme required for sulfatase activity
VPPAEPPAEGSFFRQGKRAVAQTPSQGALTPGRMLGEFRLVRKLGEGGMGQVWEARQPSQDRSVALKLMSSDHVLSELNLALFEREARAGGRLSHPCIVSVLAYGEADGIPFIAQELIGDGWTLADVIREAQAGGDLPDDWFSRVVEFVATATEALEVAHQAGVIHRDLKPHNILVGEDDRPVIADFGLAKVSGDVTLSRTGDLAGTYAYMSPEQALAKRIGIDHRADVYALGATLYEALTLRRVVDGDTHQQITENIIYADPPAPHVLRSRIDRALSVVCMKAIEKQRKDRFGSMAEFAADLRRWLAKTPVHARPAGPLRRARKWMVRHPTASAVLGVALVSSAVFARLSMQLSDQNVEIQDALDRETTLTGELEQSNRSLDAALGDARTQRQLADDSAARARREKANVLRLSAFQDLEELRREADELWPVTPARLGDYERWLGRAAPIVAGLEPSADGEEPGHRQVLLQLRAKALPRTEAERKAEREGHPSFGEWAQRSASLEDEVALLERTRAQIEAADLTGDQADQAAALIEQAEATLATERADLATLDGSIDRRRTYRFADTEDTWWHDQLQKLITEIEAFTDPETGLIDGRSAAHGWGVARRLALAATIEERTVTGADARERWGSAIASIGDVTQCPSYEGLALTPQLGLLPIGRDPDSGLWEFWHVMSGDEPVRGDDGRLVLTEESGLVLVLIPGGTFWMGARNDPGQPHHDPAAQPHEGPVHEVTLSPYLLSKYEMTVGQWERLTGHNPSKFRPENFQRSWSRVGNTWSPLLPVESVSFADSMTATRRLGLSLPSEARWEWACRAGTVTAWWSGDERESLRGVANLADSYGKTNGYDLWLNWDEWLDDGYTTPSRVGASKPNPFGLHEVHGNLFEACLDAYDEGFYAASPAVDPVNDKPRHPDRVFRGGSFLYTSRFARSSERFTAAIDFRDRDLGLRPARDLAP